VLDGATSETIGLIDFVTESPTDGYPWIGLVLVHRSRQRQGIGTEMLTTVAAHLHADGHPAVRMAVIEGNEAGLAFARSLDFETVTHVPTTGTESRVLVMELDLAAPHRPA
jgi:GNAT superfamily N-acetyltransferase